MGTNNFETDVNTGENGIIRRKEKQDGSAIPDTGFLEDKRLSWEAKGIFAYLLAKNEEWEEMDLEGIFKAMLRHKNTSKSSIYAGLKELEECGLIEITEKQV